MQRPYCFVIGFFILLLTLQLPTQKNGSRW
jgi:hypothetical protein